MWYNNGIVEKQFEEGDQPDDFVKGRLPKIKKIDILKEKISKEDLYNYYILENNSFIETVSYFNIQPNGLLNQLLRFYGIHKDPKAAAKNNKSIRYHESYVLGGLKSSKTQKQSWANRSEEEREDWSNKQKLVHSTETAHNNMSNSQRVSRENLKLNHPEIEKELNEKRSISCKKAWSDKDLVAKRNETAKNNRLLRKDEVCRTKSEQKIYNELIKYYSDLRYDEIVDDRYPYYVDFYIPCLDLFIEYQGFPSHGAVPYDKTNKKSLEECYKLYGSWLYDYTVRDPEKYEVALNNNINLIRIYPQATLEENYEINNNKFKDIISLIYKNSL